MSKQVRAETKSAGAHDFPRRRTRGIECHELGDELLVTDVPADRAHFLNTSMATVWKLCDGTRSADQITERLAEFFDCSQAGDLGQTARKALQTLAALDLLGTGESIKCGPSPGTQPDRGPRLSPPLNRSSTSV